MADHPDIPALVARAAAWIELSEKGMVRVAPFERTNETVFLVQDLAAALSNLTRALAERDAEASAGMPDVRQGDIIDLIDPERIGYVVGTNWDAPSAWKNPKAARRIVRVWRIVWSKDGTE